MRPRHGPRLTRPIALALIALTACASGDRDVERPRVETIDANAFRDPDASPSPVTTRRAETTAPATTGKVTVTERAVALVGGPRDIDPPEPTDDESEAPSTSEREVRSRAQTTTAAGDRLIVDRMVGQINGKPIYASEFFRDMDARLRAESQKRGTREWLAFAARQIRDELTSRIRDELLLAEFQSALSPEERQGVLGFLRYLREDVIRRNLGSEAIADTRLQQREGLTLNQYLQREKERRFIAEQVNREISSRVNVSYRDIKSRYERNRDEYEPKPTAVLRIIRVRASNREAHRAVEEALARGVPTDEIARDYGSFNRNENGLRRVTLEKRDIETQEFFPQPELDEPTRELSVGETTEPIEYGSNVYWIHLENIDRPESKSLYDVQLQIERELQAEYTLEEQRRYFARVQRRGSYTNFEEMQRQLLLFAAERYLIIPQVDQQAIEGEVKGEGG